VSAPRRWVRVATASLLLGAALPVATISSARAEDIAPVLPILAPVMAIRAPVLDISFGEADLKRQARVDQTPRRTVITFDSTVLFAKDSPKINSRARSRLTEVGRGLKAEGAGSVKITGYTDDLGSKAHGRTLSRQRAQAVSKVLRRYLPAKGYRFTVRGLGESHPAVPNSSEHNRKINRRVVVVYQAR
jgi:outer membrane protein OmpA-like peptidoglycan-associated protein